MNVDPEIINEWRTNLVLSRDSVHWLHDHGDPDDPHPIVTGLEIIRQSLSFPSDPATNQGEPPRALG